MEQQFNIQDIDDETMKLITTSKAFNSKLTEVQDQLNDEMNKRGLKNIALRSESQKDAKEQLIKVFYGEQNSAALKIQSWLKSRSTTNNKDIKSKQ